ncbi:MAG: nuclear transport factor 2 family protein [Chthoniobacterales bacterium]
MKLVTPVSAIALLAFATAPAAFAQASPAAAAEKPAAAHEMKMEKPADTSAIKAAIKSNEDAWAKAQMDKDHGVAVIGAMVAEDFHGVTSKGVVQNKAAMLEKMKADTDTYSSSVNDSVDVNVYGSNVATACGKSTEKGKDKDGKEFTRTYAWTDTWMERNGKWECIGGAGTLVSDKK